MAPRFMETLQKLAKPKDLEAMAQWNAVARGPSFGSALGIEVTEDELKRLALCPLEALSEHVSTSTRAERGLAAVHGKLEALDGVADHDAASSAVAKSMLARMTMDVAAYAADANERVEGRMKGVDDVELVSFFMGTTDAGDTTMQAASVSLSSLLADLKQMRDEDARSISDVIPLLRHAANFVQLGSSVSASSALESASPEEREQLGRTLFVLKQACRQVPEVSVEFMFGATLSSKAVEDIEALNPHLKAGTLDLILRLVGVTMLRANRVGHANRCIGMCVRLLSLVDSALRTSAGSAERLTAAETLVPKMAQASAALAEGLQSQRHFMHEIDKSQAVSAAAESGSTARPGVEYDPRFLIFEFVWNILLRQKQVEIVHMFRKGLAEGRSKVKQMIMVRTHLLCFRAEP